MRLTGMEGKLDQYAAGERFIAAVEAVAGRRAIDVCWSSPAMLPSIDEIRNRSSGCAVSADTPPERARSATWARPEWHPSSSETMRRRHPSARGSAARPVYVPADPARPSPAQRPPAPSRRPAGAGLGRRMPADSGGGRSFATDRTGRPRPGRRRSGPLGPVMGAVGASAHAYRAPDTKRPSKTGITPRSRVLERRDSGVTERHGRCSGSDRPACALAAVACRRAGTSGVAVMRLAPSRRRRLTGSSHSGTSARRRTLPSYCSPA